jgi:hypothetical protein
MTQRDLALATGYSVGQICRFEQNQFVPDRPTLTARFLPALGQTSDTATAERLLVLADAARAAQQREQRRSPPVRRVVEQPGVGHTPALAPVAATTLTTPRDRPIMSLVNGHTAEPSSQLIRMETEAATAQPADTPTPPDRNRSRMLAKVKTFWIKGILEQSLHGAAPIELRLEDKADAVAHPWDMIVQQAQRSIHPLPSGTRISSVFDALDGEILILGAPGAGKTTLLLELTRELIARAEHEVAHPIPVVFNLSAWAEHRLPLAVWLVDELSIRYDVPRQLGQAWIESDQLLLLLDGLDEVQQEYRDTCVDALNTFRHEHGWLNMVICCRTADYAGLTRKLKLQGAVVIQPLTPAQIDTYLVNAGGQLVALRAALAEDPALQDLAQSPLMLRLMAVAYASGVHEPLVQTSSVELRRQQLFTTYLAGMFTRRGVNNSYPRQRTIYWLAWLACMLQRHNQTLFFLEQMQPRELLTRSQYRAYAIGVGLITGVVASLVSGIGARFVHGWFASAIIGLDVGLVMGSVIGLTIGRVAGSGKTRMEAWQGRDQALRSTLGLGIGVGLATGLVISLLVGKPYPLISGLIAGVWADVIVGVAQWRMELGTIATVETLSWSWAKAQVQLRRKLLVGLGVGCVVGLVVGLAQNPVIGLARGLAMMLAINLFMVLAAGLSANEIETKIRPNQGVWRSVHYAIRLGLVSGLVFGLVSGLTMELIHGYARPPLGLVQWLKNGLVYGFAVAMLYGGFTSIQHSVLRLILWYSGVIPWNYVRFLDYCVEHIFLQRVGGGYMFVHRLLLEYFAALNSQHSTPSVAPSDPLEQY